MVPGNDNVESFHNSVKLLENSLESSFRKLTKDFEHCWSASTNGANNALNFVSKKSELRSLCGFQSKVGKNLLIECLVGDLFGNLVQNFRKLDLGTGEIECTSSDLVLGTQGGSKVNHVKAFIGMLEGRRGDVCGVLVNVKFARVGGVPLSNVAVIDSEKEEMSLEASAVAPTVDKPAESVLKSALAGGISCAFSSFIMHPVDTIKTQVQASTLTLPEIIVKIPQIGARGLYKGSIPAVSGQFLGHGLRTAICEASKFVLVYLAPTLPDIQVQSAASLCSTVLGTTFRVPTEVIKQRLQAGIYENVGEALTGTWQQDGLKGFFRGTGATLCREVPFYVAGAGLYAESKKAIQHLLGRELEPWETIFVGAVSGGLASVTTTPFDVIKTRMMTATPGQPVSMSMIALSIIRHEGPLGLFKGAVPRFFWVAPLGAMNFAGYELLRKAMDRTKTQKVSTAE
ncbi:Mitochondrial substrate carrier family protein [Heracleum sosnowskyi]|uniref:Mitochondrial substrate carrier family protein n=1 Tax=Heracleum sosnowskyi TaxID=360622 RepID=A0AAD8MBZ3_9APIA|nr:Mitochondrial substrate carrier family protein [Heracleum sosnowskyi]